jgi:antitoxin (DNA-binding transcriptional repressor) of toxin-antitoxin stability system
MRNVSIEELEEHTADLISEVEAGHRLTLVRGGRAIADIVPREGEPTEAERVAAGERLLEIIRKGIDLGGLRITNRDELYEREPYSHD